MSATHRYTRGCAKPRAEAMARGRVAAVHGTAPRHCITLDKIRELASSEWTSPQPFASARNSEFQFLQANPPSLGSFLVTLLVTLISTSHINTHSKYITASTENLRVCASLISQPFPFFCFYRTLQIHLPCAQTQPSERVKEQTPSSSQANLVYHQP